MTPGGWESWAKLDAPTVAWLVWIFYFLLLESWALLTVQPQHTLTWHVRPFLLAHPLAWFVALGAWLWIGAHFLAPAWEVGLLRVLRG